MRSNLPADLCR
jgi:hypothetical protein